MSWLAVKEVFVSGYIFFVGTILPTIYDRLNQLITAPWHHEQMIWIVIPLAISTILMKFYFGRYSREELGWNTAVGNNLVLFFVSLDLLRYVNQGDLGTVIKNISALTAQSLIAFYVGIAAIVLFLFDFFHVLPKKIAFFLGNSLVINLTAYVAIVLTYTNPIGAKPGPYSVPLDQYTFIAAFILFWLLWMLFWVITLFEPKKEERPSMTIDLNEIDLHEEEL